MELLLDDSVALWAIDEIRREIGDPIAVTDSLARLRGVGLIHVFDLGFVKPSRAARYFDRLELP
ncbi:MAG TPA: hypothetical protein VGO24_06525 [Solirubrobacterales bacterium]|jgi:hypothetical protein|nr:hypothetical protein [Solirubrobacterales bacterium]